MDVSKLNLSRDVLKRIKRSALFHAYIISGGTSEGRRALAMEIAKAAVCSEPGENPCGHCSDCYKAENNIHPDIAVIARLEDKKEIVVDQMREIKADSAIMPNEAEKKVYIIDEAETMNGTAQNTMLKLLEEPPAHAHFLLLTENVKMFLPTVRSRCIELSITPEKEERSSSDEAENLFSILEKGDKFGLLSFAFANERMERETLRQLAADVRRMAAEKMREDKNAENRPELMHIAEVFWKIQQYTDRNVSAGHAMSLLLSEFA